MNIAIWGLGVSGTSALKYLKTKTNHTVYAINNGDLKDWKDKDLVKQYLDPAFCFNQNNAKDLAEKIDLIVLSPGIDPRIKELKPFKDIKKICEIELASKETNIPIIALTGTNGKTTTVTMIAKALELAGKSVFLGGNIGIPFCEMLLDSKEYDIAILELSSFQLELLDTFHPKISILLNITKSHMERYTKFEDYQEAKLNIVNNQNETDIFISSPDFIKTQTLAKKELFSSVEGYDFSKSKLVGTHNKLNLGVVETVLSSLNVSDIQSIIQNLINEFNGVKFRLEFVRTINNVDFYNDAKSTNTASTLAAIEAFGNKQIILILGGKLRDNSQDLLSEFKNCSNISKVYCIGESRDFIYAQLNEKFKIEKVESLEGVMNKMDIVNSDIVLFSPGFPSFDQYKNYLERGMDFEKRVIALS